MVDPIERLAAVAQALQVLVELVFLGFAHDVVPLFLNVVRQVEKFLVNLLLRLCSLIDIFNVAVMVY